MKLYKINTTAYEEEDFFVITNLSREDILFVLEPIIKEEREDDELGCRDNKQLFKALQIAYPTRKMTMIVEAEQISI